MDKKIISEDMFYLVGALGDGCLSTEYTVVYIQKNKEWLSKTIIPLLNRNFFKTFSEMNLRYQYGAWRLKFKSKIIWQTLKTLRDETPESDKAKKFYIAGYWDTEGSCSDIPRALKKPFINFTQKDQKSLINLKEMLNEFGIKSGKVRISDKKKMVWRLWIENINGINKFCKEIGSLHPEKIIKLKQLKHLLSARQREHEPN